MGLREKVTLLLVAVVFQIAQNDCKPQSIIENPFERYNINIGNRKIKTFKQPHDEEANYNMANEYSATSNMHQNLNFPDDDFPLHTTTEKSYNIGSSRTRKQATTDKYDTNLIENLRKDARRTRKLKQHVNKKVVPEQVQNTQPFYMAKIGTFPVVEYPLSAMDTWTPKYWNPVPFDTEDKNFNSDAFSQAKPNTKQNLQYIKPSSLKNNKGLFAAVRKTEENNGKYVKTTNVYDEKLEKLNDIKNGTTIMNSNLQNNPKINFSIDQPKKDKSKTPPQIPFSQKRRTINKKVLSRPLKARSRLKALRKEIPCLNNNTCSIDQGLNSSLPKYIEVTNKTAGNIAINVTYDAVLFNLNSTSNINQSEDTSNSSFQPTKPVLGSMSKNITHESLLDPNKFDDDTDNHFVKEISRHASNTTSTITEEKKNLLTTDFHPTFKDENKLFRNNMLPEIVNILQPQLRTLSSDEQMDLAEKILALIGPVPENYAALEPPLYTDGMEQFQQIPSEQQDANLLPFKNLSREYVIRRNENNKLPFSGEGKNNRGHQWLPSGMISNLSELNNLVDSILAQVGLLTNETVPDDQSIKMSRVTGILPTDFILTDTASMDVLSALSTTPKSENVYKDSFKSNHEGLNDKLNYGQFCDHENQQNALHKQTKISIKTLSSQTSVNNSVAPSDFYITSKQYLLDNGIPRYIKDKNIHNDSQYELICPNPALKDQCSVNDGSELEFSNSNAPMAGTLIDILTSRTFEPLTTSENNFDMLKPNSSIHDTEKKLNSDFANIINNVDNKANATSYFSSSLIDNTNISKIINAFNLVDRLANVSPNYTEAIKDKLLNKIISVCEKLLNMEKTIHNAEKYSQSDIINNKELLDMPGDCVLLDLPESETMLEKPINDNLSEKYIKLDDSTNYVKPNQPNLDNIPNLLDKPTLIGVTYNETLQNIQENNTMSNQSYCETLINGKPLTDILSSDYTLLYIPESETIIDKLIKDNLSEKYIMLDDSANYIKPNHPNSDNITNVLFNYTLIGLADNETLQNIQENNYVSNQLYCDTLINNETLSDMSSDCILQDLTESIAMLEKLITNMNNISKNYITLDDSANYIKPSDIDTLPNKTLTGMAYYQTQHNVHEKNNTVPNLYPINDISDKYKMVDGSGSYVKSDEPNTDNILNILANHALIDMTSVKNIPENNTVSKLSQCGALVKNATLSDIPSDCLLLVSPESKTMLEKPINDNLSEKYEELDDSANCVKPNETNTYIPNLSINHTLTYNDTLQTIQENNTVSNLFLCGILVNNNTKDMPSDCLLLDSSESEMMLEKSVNENLSEKYIMLDDSADYLRPDATNTDDNIPNLLVNHVLIGVTYNNTLQSIQENNIVPNQSIYELVNNTTLKDMPSDRILLVSPENEITLEKPINDNLFEKYIMLDNSANYVESDEANTDDIPNLPVNDTLIGLSYNNTLQTIQENNIVTNMSPCETLLNNNTLKDMPSDCILLVSPESEIMLEKSINDNLLEKYIMLDSSASNEKAGKAKTDDIPNLPNNHTLIGLAYNDTLQTIQENNTVSNQSLCELVNNNTLNDIPSDCIQLVSPEIETLLDNPINDNLSEKYIMLDNSANYVESDEAPTDDIPNLLDNHTLIGMTYNDTLQTLQENNNVSNQTLYELINNTTLKDVPCDFILLDVPESETLPEKQIKANLSEKYIMLDDLTHYGKPDEPNTDDVPNLLVNLMLIGDNMTYNKTVKNIQDNCSVSNLSNYDTLNNNMSVTVLAQLPEQNIATCNHNFSLSEISLLDNLSDTFLMTVETTKLLGSSNTNWSDTISSTNQNLIVFTGLVELDNLADLEKAVMTFPENTRKSANIDKNIVPETDNTDIHPYTTLTDYFNSELSEYKLCPDFNNVIIATDDKIPEISASNASEIFIQKIFTNMLGIDNATVKPSSENIEELADMNENNVPDRKSPDELIAMAGSENLTDFVSIDTLPDLPDTNLVPMMPDANINNVIETNDKVPAFSVSYVSVNVTSPSISTPDIDTPTAITETHNNKSELIHTHGVSEISSNDFVRSDILDTDHIPDAIIDDQILLELADEKALPDMNNRNALPDMPKTNIIPIKFEAKLPTFIDTNMVPVDTEVLNDVPVNNLLDLSKTDTEPGVTSVGSLGDLLSTDVASGITEADVLREKTDVENETDPDVPDQTFLAVIES